MNKLTPELALWGLAKLTVLWPECNKHPFAAALVEICNRRHRVADEHEAVVPVEDLEIREFVPIGRLEPNGLSSDMGEVRWFHRVPIGDLPNEPLTVYACTTDRWSGRLLHTSNTPKESHEIRT